MASIFKPENSIIAGLATVGLVYGIYQLDVGDVTSVQLSQPYNISASTGIKKAGWTSLALIAGVSLIAKDPNIAILGCATVIAMQAHYRHANVSTPTGQVVPPPSSSYMPASASPQAQVPLSAVS